MIYLKKAFIVENEMFSFFMTGIRGNLVAVCYLLHEPGRVVDTNKDTYIKQQ